MCLHTVVATESQESNESYLKGIASPIYLYILTTLYSYTQTVKYFTSSSEDPRSIKYGKSRCYLWCIKKKKKYEEIGIYQPKDDGYEVLFIGQGKDIYVDYIIYVW